MKTTLKSTALLLALLTLPISAQSDQNKARQINQLYQTGLAALEAGQRETARRAFQGVLNLEPGHGHARYQLATLDQNYDRVKLKQRQQKFTQTRLKQVVLDEATLGEALEALDRWSSEATQEEFSPNFVLQDPDGKLAQRRITLQLRNIPLSVALNYVLESARAKARYDEHATIITPIDGSAPKQE